MIDLQPIKEQILADAQKSPELRRSMGKIQAHEATVAWLLDYCAKAMIDRDAYFEEGKKAVAALESLKRGEFICSRCGLRKDSDPPSTDPQF